MRRYAYTFVFAIGVARLALGVWLGFRPFDDTYITFRYALNLSSGYGFVYNIGDPVLGTTSPLWAMTLAALHYARVPIEMGALVLSLGLDIVSALALYRLLTHLKYGREIAVAASVFFLFLFDFFSLARSGMETSCFVFLALASLEAMASRRFIRAALCSALAVLTRPEGVLLIVLLAIAAWNSRSVVTRRQLVACAAVVFGVTGSWAIYALRTFGSVVPQSVAAKASIARRVDLAQFSSANVTLFFLKGQYGGEIFTRTYLQLMPAISLLSCAAAAAILIAFIRRRDPISAQRALFVLFFPASYVGGLALSHAFTYFPWYYGPIYPFSAALAMVGAGTLLSGKSRPAVAICVVLIAGQVAAAIAVKLPADRSYWVEGYFDVSDGVPRTPDVTIAAPEIGAVGWHAWPATILDLEGLVTPGAVGIAADDYVEARKPDYVILRTDNAAEFLRRALPEVWFSRRYELSAVKRDPFVDREFRAYRRR